MGSNAAEHHPISFKWVLQAKEKGAVVIHVDPKFSRTSARSTFHVPLRSGTDIAFLGGMIKYIIENNKYFKDYVVEYTNAAFIVNKDFGFKDGLFCGFDAQTRKYDTKTVVLRDGRGGPAQEGQDPAGPPLRVPADEEALLALQPGQGRPASPACPRKTCSRSTRPTAPPVLPPRPGP